ncbi:hypothetical protein Q3G72_020093 [Acer saccharum]|nr:hypothetical protein Q3G72_020093 [Acer saccharum]
MDHNDLFKLCESLSLSNDEDIPITTIKGEVKQVVDRKVAFSLVGKVQTTKPVNREAFIWWMPRQWRMSKSFEELGMILGKTVGLVEELDSGSFGDCLDWFLRVRINMDISKPLKRALRVMLDGFDEMATIIVQYERGKRPRGEEETIGNGLKNNTSEGELIGDQAGGRGKHRKRCLTAYYSGQKDKVILDLYIANETTAEGQESRGELSGADDT